MVDSDGVAVKAPKIGLLIPFSRITEGQLGDPREERVNCDAMYSWVLYPHVYRKKEEDGRLTN